MDRPFQSALACLHLAALSGDFATDPAPDAATVHSIATGIGLDRHWAADRLDLLATLRTLDEEGLVTTRRGRTEGADQNRTIYQLTAEGRERARQVRERYADEHVVFDNGDTERVRITGTQNHRISITTQSDDTRPL